MLTEKFEMIRGKIKGKMLIEVSALEDLIPVSVPVPARLPVLTPIPVPVPIRLPTPLPVPEPVTIPARTPVLSLINLMATLRLEKDQRGAFQ